jgi:hypothetical protein
MGMSWENIDTLVDFHAFFGCFSDVTDAPWHLADFTQPFMRIERMRCVGGVQKTDIN